MPGGFDTLKELLAVVTLKRPGYHSKGIVVLEVDGWYGPGSAGRAVGNPFGE